MARLTILRPMALLIALSWVLGCAGDPACERQIALMRAELIDLEDRYALLQAKYDDATGTCDDPEAKSSGPLQKLLEKSAEPKSNNGQPKSKDDIQIELDPQDVSLGARFQVPQINRPAPATAAPRTRSTVSADEMESLDPAAADLVQPVTYEEISESTNHDNVLASVMADAVPNGELQVVAGPLAPTDPNAIADGLELLLIRQGVDGQPGWVPGDLSIAVLDPAEPDPSQQRVGTWHFSWRELAGDPRAGDTLPPHLPLRLPLTWNFHPPEHEQLRVLVRFAPHSGDPPLEAVVPVRLDQPRSRSGEDELEQRLNQLTGDKASPLAGDSTAEPAPDDPTWQPRR